MPPTYKPPEHITIPTPQRGSQVRGRHAKKTTDPHMTIRMPMKFRDTIDKAAKLLDITSAEFIRWVALMSATRVLETETKFFRDAKGYAMELHKAPQHDLSPFTTDDDDVHVLAENARGLEVTHKSAILPKAVPSKRSPRRPEDIKLPKF